MARASYLAIALCLAGSGCFGPTIAEGLACGEGNACPPDQVCDLRTDTCVKELADEEDDIDAAATPPTDATAGPDAACPPGNCPISLDTEVTDIDVSQVDGCSLANSNGSRNVGVDSANRIYAVFTCGAGSTAFAAVSFDGGQTFGTPIDLMLEGVDEIAVSGIGDGVAVAAAFASDGLFVMVTTDGGASWAAPVLLANGIVQEWGVSIETDPTNAWIAARINATTVVVFRNQSPVQDGTWSETSVAHESTHGDIVLDDGARLWVTGDDPDMVLRRSINNGASFPIVFEINRDEDFSDWTFADKLLVATGNDGSVTVMDASNPDGNNDTEQIGLPPAIQRMRSISGAGVTVFTATGRPIGQVHVARITGDGVQATRNIDEGNSPAVVAVSDEIAAVVYANDAGRILLNLYLF